MRRQFIVSLVILAFLASCITAGPLIPVLARSSNGMHAINLSEHEGFELVDSISENQYADGRKVRYNASKQDPILSVATTLPIRAGDRMIRPIKQLAVLPARDSTIPGWNTADARHGYNSVPSAQASPNKIVGGVAGKFLDNDREQLIVMYNNRSVAMFDGPYNDSRKAWEYHFEDVPFDPVTVTFFPSLARGDFGGNGTHQLAVMWYWQSADPITHHLHWKIIDVKLNTTVLDQAWSSGTGDIGVGSTIVVGDMDGDGRDELVVVFGKFSELWVHDDASAGYSRTRLSGVGNHVPGDRLNGLVAGDTNGNGKEELIAVTLGVEIWPMPRGYHHCTVLSWSVDSSTFTISSFQMAGTVDGAGWLMPYITAGDFTGRGLTQVAVSATSPVIGGGSLVVYDLHPVSLLHEVSFEVDNFLNGSRIAALDLDADGNDELVVVGSRGMTILDDAAGNFTTLYQNTTLMQEYSNPGNFIPESNPIVPGNYDGAGIALSYTGRMSTYSTNPGIMVAFAASPFYNGVPTNLASSYTGYGTTTSQGSGESTAVGTTSGWGVSVEAKFSGAGPVWSGGFGVKLGYECEEEFKETGTVTSTTSWALKYLAGSTDNGILFQTTMYDVFDYAIVDHPNATWIGSVMRFHIPRAPSIFKTTTSFFNRIFPDAPRIGAETFNHTVGQPWTYPRSSNVMLIAPHRWTSATSTSGLGSGSNVVTIEVSQQTSTDVSTSWSSKHSVGASAELGYAFFSLSVEGQYSWGDTGSRSFTTTIGNSTIFEGSVGDFLHDEDFSLLNFSFGLFAYDLHRDGGNISYRVLNYWIDDAPLHLPLVSLAMMESLFPVAVFGMMLLGPVIAIVRPVRQRRKTRQTRK